MDRLVEASESAGDLTRTLRRPEESRALRLDLRLSKCAKHPGRDPSCCESMNLLGHPNPPEILLACHLLSCARVLTGLDSDYDEGILTES
jgi:hypothetical protein